MKPDEKEKLRRALTEKLAFHQSKVEGITQMHKRGGYFGDQNGRSSHDYLSDHKQAVRDTQRQIERLDRPSIGDRLAGSLVLLIPDWPRKLNRLTNAIARFRRKIEIRN